MRSRLADAATERLSNPSGDEPAMTEDEVLRVLARIARHGKPGDRLRAAELIGRRLGMFSEKNEPACRVTLEMLVPRRILRVSPKTAEAEIVSRLDGSSGEERT